MATRRARVITLELLRKRFAGQIALIFASGPSLTKLWSADRSIPFPSIAVNDAWKIAPTADICYATDAKWWMHHAKSLQAFAGLKVGYEGPGPVGIIWLKGSGKLGFDERLGYVRHGWNSGHAAVHLAAQLGARRIVLVGFDMRVVNGKHHFFGDHPRAVQRQTTSLYPAWIENFSELAKALAERKIEVLNATPGSALAIFPPVDLEDVCGLALSASSRMQSTIVGTPSRPG